MTRTALIAGRGALPEIVAARLSLDGKPPVLAELEGFESLSLAREGVERFRLERLVPFLDRLVDLGVTRAVFAGGVHRPRLDPALLDPATMQLLPRIMAAMGQGDDGALREVIALMGEWGIEVVGVQDICPELLPDAGQLGAHSPNTQDRKDIARGFTILQAMGTVDVGQGCCVARGQCLAMEALPGTDVMLGQLADLRPGALPEGGVFCKAPKVDQDHRIDLPALGVATVEGAHKAGLRGIAVQAGGVLMLDAPAMIARADELGLFLLAEP